jgi:hypothetical protein
MRSARRGHTIFELMTASFLLGVVLTVCGRLAWLASRSKSSSEAQNFTYRQASIALERMQREAAHTQEVYKPSPALLLVPAEVLPTNPLVLRSRNFQSASGQAVISYYRDPVKEELVRLTYQVNYDPASPPSQVILDKPKVVATGVTSFVVYQVDPLTRSTSQNLSLRLVVRNKDAKRALALPLATEVRLAR